jgi:hypothetical protein
METQVCLKCGLLKELTTGFYVHRNSKIGYQSECKECQNKSRREYKSKVKSGAIALAREIKYNLYLLNKKICNTCHIEKELSEEYFYKKKERF